MIDHLPEDIIVELGKGLERPELLSLYAVCRRCRDVVVNLLQRWIAVAPYKIPKMSLFAAENTHFARSIATLHLYYDRECTWVSDSVDKADIQRKTTIKFPEARAFLFHLFIVRSYGCSSEADFLRRNSAIYCPVAMDGPYLILLLASLSWLKLLGIGTTPKTRVVVYDILNLLSRGYLPELRRYCDIYQPSPNIANQNINYVPASTADKEPIYTSIISKSNLDLIELRIVKWT
jgi:hypothetical protein